MGIIGGDLVAMETLATRFVTASEVFSSTSSHLVERASVAAQRFGEEMARLDREARGLSSEIDQALAGLRQQASATAWTGAHRAQQDAALHALDDDIVRLRSAIDTFSDEASSIVDGSLRPALADMQRQVGDAGATAQRIAHAFASGVSSQRLAFDQVMNG